MRVCMCWVCVSDAVENESCGNLLIFTLRWPAVNIFSKEIRSIAELLWLRNFVDGIHSGHERSGLLFSYWKLRITHSLAMNNNFYEIDFPNSAANKNILYFAYRILVGWTLEVSRSTQKKNWINRLPYCLCRYWNIGSRMENSKCNWKINLKTKIYWNILGFVFLQLNSIWWSKWFRDLLRVSLCVANCADLWKINLTNSRSESDLIRCIEIIMKYCSYSVFFGFNQFVVFWSKWWWCVCRCFWVCVCVISCVVGMVAVMVFWWWSWCCWRWWNVLQIELISFGIIELLNIQLLFCIGCTSNCSSSTSFPTC